MLCLIPKECFSRISAVALALCLLLEAKVVLPSAVRRNVMGIKRTRIVIGGSSNYDLNTVIPEQPGHWFDHFVQAHLLAANGKWEDAARECEQARTKIGERGATDIDFLWHLCQARHLASRGEWKEAAWSLTRAWIQNPGLAALLSKELRIVLGYDALDEWRQTGNPIHLCHARFYFDDYSALEPDDAATQEQADCNSLERFLVGPLQGGETKAWIALDPAYLEFPGYFPIKLLSEELVAPETLIQASNAVVLNLIGNGGFTLSDRVGRALGIGKYYLDDEVSYENLSFVGVDSISGRRYLAVAPKRGRRPDTLAAGRFLIQRDHSYLVGCIARGPNGGALEFGCRWLGGAAHGSAAAESVSGRDWTLRAMLVKPPLYATQCVVYLYNTGQTNQVDLDSIFFCDLGETALL